MDDWATLPLLLFQSDADVTAAAVEREINKLVAAVNYLSRIKQASADPALSVGAEGAVLGVLVAPAMSVAGAAVVPADQAAAPSEPGLIRCAAAVADIPSFTTETIPAHYMGEKLNELLAALRAAGSLAEAS